MLWACGAYATTPPTFQAAGTAVSGTGSRTPAWPAHAVDDIALLIVESAGGEPVSLSTPAGFVAVANSPQATGNSATGTQISVFWARASSTAMASPTIADPGNHVYAQILTYRGVVNTGNPWNVTGGGVKATASNSVFVTGVTTTVANTLVVQAVSRDLDVSTTQFSGEASSTLSGITERVDGGTTSGNGGGFAVWDGAMISAGATGNTAANLASNAVNAFLTIALAPQPPTVASINTASANPTSPATSVSWTVTFNSSVSGVNLSDFVLAASGGVSGAAITSVNGSGTTWTVNATTGSGSGTLGLNLVDNDSIVDASGVPLGGAGGGNGNFTGQAYTVSPPFCSPPANTPAGLTLSCVCDTFARSSLNPSPIFGSNWIVSTSDQTGIVPSIVNQGYLRLTNNTGNNAKAATVPGIFPAAGNYISVEFQHYAYNGSSADGIAVTLSDYSVTAVPGAFGGSLGYAQKTGSACNTTSCPGFAGGWIGVALDEFGNYQNPTEGRIGGPGFIAQSVGVRGSGSGNAGYNWMGGSNALTPQIDNSGSTSASPGYYYQVVVDARGEPSSTRVIVNRNTGTGYSQLINIPNVYVAANGQGFTQAPVPANWQISFTGSTGGSTNIHEIAGLRICASTILPPTGGTAGGFNAIDEAYGTPPSVAVQNYLTGHVYTKLIGTPFKLNVAALNNNQILTTYALGSAKSVTLKLVDNSDGACVLDSAQPNYCSAACTGRPAVAGGSQTVSFASGASDKGQKQSANFTLNTAYKNLAVIIGDGTTTACSTDSFAVRPTAIASVVSTNATNPNPSGTPVFKAGADNVTLSATVSGVAGNANGYNGVPKINNSGVQVVSPASVVGAVSGTFSSAVSGTPTATATGTAFKYSEVGAFQLLGYDPATNATSARGVFDGVMTPTECTAPGLTTAQCDTLKAATWTGVDSVSGKGDCVADSFSNSKDANGKYGCNIGLIVTSAAVGRFIPDHFSVVGSVVPRADVIALTTGSITAGSNVLNVASAGGITAGRSITVAGAGASDGSGLDGNGLQSTVSSVAGTAVTLAAPAQTGKSGTTVYVHDSFAYMDEPVLTVMTVTAFNAAHGITRNYAGSLAKLNAASLGTGASWFDAGCGLGSQCFGFGAKDGVTSLTSRLAIDTTIASPSSSWAAGSGTFTSYFRLSRPTSTASDATWGPYDAINFGAAPVDADGVTLPSAASGDTDHQVDLDADSPAGAERRRVAAFSERFGRLRLFNHWGSDLNTLKMRMQAQYWNGLTWALNGADNATKIPLSSVALSGQTGTLNSTNMGAANVIGTGALDTAPGASPLFAGGGSIVLQCPYKDACDGSVRHSPALTGSVDLAINLSAASVSDSSCLTSHQASTAANLPWLRSVDSRCATTYDHDPSARASFGLYSTNRSNRSIHVRELF